MGDLFWCIIGSQGFLMHMMNDMNDDLDIFGPRGWPNDPSLLLVPMSG